MAEFYFSVNLDNDRTLCLAPLTDRKIALCDEQIDDPSGYFLFETCSSHDSTIEIIARVHSEEAALRLWAMFKME